MKVAAQRYYWRMPGTVKDLIEAARTAASNAQAAVTAGRETAARIAGNRAAALGSGESGAASSGGEQQSGR